MSLCWLAPFEYSIQEIEVLLREGCDRLLAYAKELLIIAEGALGFAKALLKPIQLPTAYVG